ncbi:MAG: ABC transporter permease [Cellulomonas sp. 73-145]|uniref:DMT family transporter n=1 Tax=Cellulomonas sp. 73-145 TaxID=1895739 RepID=UPI00092B09AB|nr:DMT family transporter [Cellulomonas sp. 73-145]OJV60625.1 MAG: ABC transporter permease [Cellulomonas sp. 73-145]
MEGNWRASATTAIAPVAWGATYFVTRHALPAQLPLWGSALRALPAGLLLLLVARRLPRGRWWWRSAVLGLLNTSVFFVLVYVASQRLETSTASTVMATSPFVLMLVARPLLGQHPTRAALVGAALGVAGVVAMLTTGAAHPDPLGIAASVSAMVMSSVGYGLATRWRDDIDVISSTAWQLVGGGLLLTPAALLVEGPPPHLGPEALLAVAYVTLVATAVAYLAWFSGLRRLPASAVGLLGLLNPVTGVTLGLLLGGERLGPLQVVGTITVLAAVLVGQPSTAAVVARLRAPLVRGSAPVPGSADESPRLAEPCGVSPR